MLGLPFLHSSESRSVSLIQTSALPQSVSVWPFLSQPQLPRHAWKRALCCEWSIQSLIDRVRMFSVSEATVHNSERTEHNYPTQTI